MRILFVCYANACRSQIAQAYAAARVPRGVEVESAGVIAAAIPPLTRETVRAWGLDMEGQRSKNLEEVDPGRFDLVVTLSEKARRRCDELGIEVEREHWPILDPAGVRGTPEHRREVFDLTAEDLAHAIDDLLTRRFEAAHLRPRPARPGPGGG